MTKHQYRILVAASLVFGLLGGALDLVVPALVPDPFHVAQAEYDETVSAISLSIGLLLGIPGFCMALAATYGLFRFRRWAPSIGVVGTLLSLFAVAFLGPTAQSGPATALTDLSSCLWGASILLPYIPQYRAWFTAEAASSQQPR